MAKTEQKVKAVINPDFDWAYAKNSDYAHTNWYSTPNGQWEKRVAKKSPLDDWTGINYNKIPNGVGEYYGVTNVPLFDEQWNEEEYYSKLQTKKTDEQVETELNEPRNALESKWKEFTSKGEDVVWTPVLAAMSNPTVSTARQIEYEISPFFQLNKQGFRKSWANIRISEYRPFNRLFHTRFIRMSSDYVFRFQLMKWFLTTRTRMTYFKGTVALTLFLITYDHVYAREFKRKYKFH